MYVCIYKNHKKVQGCHNIWPSKEQRPIGFFINIKRHNCSVYGNLGGYQTCLRYYAHKCFPQDQTTVLIREQTRWICHSLCKQWAITLKCLKQFAWLLNFNKILYAYKHSKLHEDRTTTVWVRERTSLWTPNPTAMVFSIIRPLFDGHIITWL